MKKTLIQLADGRELMYFDERDDAVRSEIDRRELPPPPPPSELRYDPLVDEWVAIAAHRQTRTYLPPSDECPLDPSSPERSTEIPAYDYDVAVFENRFPSFSHRPPIAPPVAPTPMSPVRVGAGRCEVVCFTSDHNASFASLSPQRVRTVLAALADRTAELSAMPGIEQVFCFENRGEEIGVTLRHPHGQIYAYPFVPPHTSRMLAAARRHRERTGRLLFADVLEAERAAGVRVVAANEHWTAYVPAAARWPFEVHVAPHRHVLDLTDLTDEESAAFGPVYLDVLRRCDALFDGPLPYIAAWHQAPARHPDRELAYLHLQLTSVRRAAGKLKYLAGSESAMGVFINDVRPEEAARMLREAQA
ncbi:galactose-1-phosphate uridylyltransferase [Rugosimonospora acidiphila]|uniref:Galactose-1-phosphate uridylyltransferase n=1 Tax=Rugosimonospora acidiphila TaxID=556531 RepID=A0ABP9S9P6_9ACTN